jgi:hypothetical protein
MGSGGQMSLQMIENEIILFNGLRRSFPAWVPPPVNGVNLAFARRFGT